MFDYEDAVGTGQTSNAVNDVDLRHFSIGDLLTLRDKIDSALPATSLAQMNLETEAVFLYLRAKHLQSETEKMKDVAPNQKAQVLNSCTQVLRELTAVQKEVYSSERFKAIEAVLVKTMNKWEKADAEEFFNLLQAAIDNEPNS